MPVAREEVRIERQPPTDDNVDEAMSDREISGGDHEAVLHEEQVVVDKLVSKERVRVDKEQVIEDAEVSDEVRREQNRRGEGCDAQEATKAGDRRG